jgi:hypothetical protein
MKCINNHTYVVGKHKMMIPTVEQSSALGHFPGIEVFYRLYKQGILYSSTSFEKKTSKRDNTNCCYKDSTTGSMSYGKIDCFANYSCIGSTIETIRAKLDKQSR